MSHTAGILKNSEWFRQGFTLLEVLIVGTLSALLCVGFLGFFVDEIKVIHQAGEKAEVIHQLRSGMEAFVGELQDADPMTIYFPVKSGPTVYTQIQFRKYDSSDLLWFYVNGSYSLIRAIKKTDSDWGRNIVADGIKSLNMQRTDLPSGTIKWISIDLKSVEFSKHLTTAISPGYQ